MNITCSRPMWSDSHPNIGRDMPLTMVFIISANGSAAMVKKSKLISTLLTPRSSAITLNCATAIRPPVTVPVNIASMTQNTGVRSASARV